MSQAKNVLFLFIMMFYAAAASAIDNPDAPDLVNDFLMQAGKYETKITQVKGGTQDYISTYAEYEQFLDKEINRAYKLLMANLDTKSKEALKNSQRNWLKYRDAEFEFIATNWNAKNFGSSSVISRGDYKTAIVKSRIVSLFNYIKNYPAK